MQETAKILPFPGGGVRVKKNSAAGLALAALVIVCRSAIAVLAGGMAAHLLGL